MSSVRRCVAIAIAAVAALLLLAAPASARRIRTDTKLVTFVARECPSYDSIFANRARNNILESLKDLGPDSNYGPGEPMSVEREAEPPQDVCQPITGWRFTLGTGIESRAVVGPWGALSKVTGAFDTSIVTQASTALLNDQGQDTGKSVGGAVTVQLTDDQADLAGAASRLWAQGGTPTDPVLTEDFPGPEYGFGALRCAIDDLNGDNVEWIAYPTGARHVFCFAYYVKPPPTSGTIVVRKEVDAPAATPIQRFDFEGNISFTADRHFFLSAAPGRPDDETFFRAGGATWDFTEHVPDGWQLAGIACTSKTGQSAYRADPATGRTEVDLAAEDVVTCTYSDRLPPPVAGLTLRKITRGGTGSFNFSVDPAGGGAGRTARATTTAPGVVAEALPALTDLTPGDYDVDEDRPHSDRGSWSLERVTCEGTNEGVSSTSAPVRVSLPAGGGAACTFENRFTPKGTIRLRKNSRGATGTTGFVVESVGTTPPRRYEQTATTTAQNATVLAKGDDTGTLPLGTYEITETGPSSAANGTWRLNGVLCDGLAVPASQGGIRVVLTEDHPDVDCTFYNERIAPTVLPETATGGGTRSTPLADLVLSKRPQHRVVTLGQFNRYFVTIRNRGTAVARNVTLVEQLGDRKALIRATPKRYRCSATARRVPGCVIGTVRPGQRIRIVVLVRSRFTGRRPNRAVVNTSTRERSRRNNVARAVELVRPRPRFTG